MDESTAFIDAACALRDSNIKVNFMNFGASRTTALIGVNEEDCKEAVQCLYNKLF